MPEGLPAVLGYVLAALLTIGLLVVVGMYFRLWLQAFVTRARITLLERPALIVMLELSFERSTGRNRPDTKPWTGQ